VVYNKNHSGVVSRVFRAQELAREIAIMILGVKTCDAALELAEKAFESASIDLELKSILSFLIFRAVVYNKNHSGVVSSVFRAQKRRKTRAYSCPCDAP